MRVVIFSGGTGSIALQRGLYHLLDTRLDGVCTKIIVNAYDNALSSGAVRKVVDGKILAPSDVRKNHATRLQLESPASPWLGFLNDRFTVESAAVRSLCSRKVALLTQLLEQQAQAPSHAEMLCGALESYFSSPSAPTIEYRDFSFANIIYAGLAKMNGNSLRMAAKIMAEAMNIPDHVLLNDDESLFLGAITRSGERVHDEGEIVSWGNAIDPFVDVFFSDVHGNARKPHLCLEAWKAIIEADLIILSSGTLWSSLIPTYASEGFQVAINDSEATVLMVMNRVPDRDSPGQTASDIIDILVPRYFGIGRLHVIADKNGHSSMRTLERSALSKVASFTRARISKTEDKPDKHDPQSLADAIGCVYFRDYLNGNFVLFDYDDTLVGRGNRYPRSSRVNMRALHDLNRLIGVGICSGNSIRAINATGETGAPLSRLQIEDKSIQIFADGGLNEYKFHTDLTGVRAGGHLEPVRCIYPDALLPASGAYAVERVIEGLLRAGLPFSSIENRGNALIAIKPVAPDDRSAVVSLVRHILAGSDLQVRSSGKTTIEICKPTLSKVWSVRSLFDRFDETLKLTYVGDECASGNDHDIETLTRAHSESRCLRVRSPTETAFFIHALITHLRSNAQR
jgi:2-phospho-L-lactate transferase/gluconeogenesis factor (CofD/UPF0052 family)